jgi:hypothetical protein
VNVINVTCLRIAAFRQRWPTSTADAGSTGCLRLASGRKARKPVLKVAGKAGEPASQTLAREILRPTLRAAQTVRDYGGGMQDLDLKGLMDALGEQVRLAKGGDLSRGEAMLVAQAHSLDAIFHACAHRAALNMGEYIGAAETYLRLALKAQSQSRATWQALAEIRNPRTVAFVQQANLTTGPQQVNNGVPGQPGEIGKRPNELLEATHGERLDPGAAGAAGRPDPHLEAVGAVHRPEDTRG